MIPHYYSEKKKTKKKKKTVDEIRVGSPVVAVVKIGPAELPAADDSGNCSLVTEKKKLIRPFCMLNLHWLTVGKLERMLSALDP